MITISANYLFYSSLAVSLSGVHLHCQCSDTCLCDRRFVTTCKEGGYLATGVIGYALFCLFGVTVVRLVVVMVMLWCMAALTFSPHFHLRVFFPRSKGLKMSAFPLQNYFALSANT